MEYPAFSESSEKTGSLPEESKRNRMAVFGPFAVFHYLCTAKIKTQVRQTNRDEDKGR